MCVCVCVYESICIYVCLCISALHARGQAADTLMDVDLKLMLVNYLGHVAVTRGSYS